MCTSHSCVRTAYARFAWEVGTMAVNVRMTCPSSVGSHMGCYIQRNGRSHAGKCRHVELILPTCTIVRYSLYDGERCSTVRAAAQCQCISVLCVQGPMDRGCGPDRQTEEGTTEGYRAPRRGPGGGEGSEPLRTRRDRKRRPGAAKARRPGHFTVQRPLGRPLSHSGRPSPHLHARCLQRGTSAPLPPPPSGQEEGGVRVAQSDPSSTPPRRQNRRPTAIQKYGCRGFCKLKMNRTWFHHIGVWRLRLLFSFCPANYLFVLWCEF